MKQYETQHHQIPQHSIDLSETHQIGGAIYVLGWKNGVDVQPTDLQTDTIGGAIGMG